MLFFFHDIASANQVKREVMERRVCTKEMAETANNRFDKKVYKFLRNWAQNRNNQTLLRFDQPLDMYLANDALRDFFLNTQHPIQALLTNSFIARHLRRRAKNVYFDPANGDPLLAPIEQRIYNLARRMDSEQMHIPFRTVHPNKQTERGDTANIDTYPTGCEEVRYNSGNHFISRPANNNVFDENSVRCTAKATACLHVLFKRGFLEDRLQDVKTMTAEMREAGETRTQFFLIYSRHSQQEGHFGVSLVTMEPENPDFPKRVLVCDTLLKELPHHPRWWHHFIAEYSQVFGDAVAELVEDISHPLQKVNVKGDAPYRHDWDCPYYAASMADALADLVNGCPELLLAGAACDIHNAMKNLMPDYYQKDQQIKDRQDIRTVNRLKRWKSGRILIKELVAESVRKSSYEL